MYAIMLVTDKCKVVVDLHHSVANPSCRINSPLEDNGCHSYIVGTGGAGILTSSPQIQAETHDATCNKSAA